MIKKIFCTRILYIIQFRMCIIMIKPINKSIFVKTPRTMPKGLIYNHPKSDKYILIETKTRQIIGDMVALNVKSDEFETNFYKIGSDKNIFYINSLDIVYWKRNQGWGKYLIDFAKHESYRQGCEGRTFLVAYNYDRPPHLFYKKQGFNAVDKEVDATLDECLEQGISPHRCGAVEMYLPIEATNKTKNITTIEPSKSGWQNVKEFFQKHFS